MTISSHRQTCQILLLIASGARWTQRVIQTVFMVQHPILKAQVNDWTIHKFKLDKCALLSIKGEERQRYH